MTLPAIPGMPPEMMAEVTRVTRETRALIETADMPFNASATLTVIIGFILMAKHNGMSREQFQTAVDNVWGLMDAQEAERAKG